MLYRKIGQTGCRVSQLGFGCMRLKAEDGTVDMMNPNKAVDQQLATRLIHYAIDCGVNYFDTAYPYLGGQSETVLGKALQGERRQMVLLTTKLPLWFIKSGEDFEAILNRQLQKLMTDHLDFYLLHGLNATSWEKALSFNVLEFLERIKADGRVRHVGFSFHDQFPVFKSIVDAYNWSLCQIQLNYVDLDYQAGLRGLQYAAEKRLGLVIMEPLRGGKLAGKLPPEVEAIWQRGQDQTVAGRVGVAVAVELTRSLLRAERHEYHAAARGEYSGRQRRRSGYADSGGTGAVRPGQGIL